VSELGLYDLRNRFMSPEMGRFLQPDPIGFKGDASNLYRYCHNDPEDFTDPMGLVNMSETPADEAAHLAWERSYNPKDRFTLSAHANENYYVDRNGKPLRITQVVERMIAKGYDGTKLVESNACESGRGKNPPAKQLQRELSAHFKKAIRVRGPTTDIGNGAHLGEPARIMREKDPKHPDPRDKQRYKPDKPENVGKLIEFGPKRNK
jgi:uncharacterized protein RhaS with RHS repeats